MTPADRNVEGNPSAEATRAILLLLAFANFVIGMGAFVVVGVLTPVAEAFALTKAGAGWMLTGYALVYAVLSPVLVALTGRVDRKVVLLAGLALFGAGAAIAALAPSYAVLLAGRVVMAGGGGLVTPVAASIGVALSAPEARGRALATIFGGLTLAQVLGVPAGAWLGYALGWQAAFAAVALLTVAGFAVVARSVPRGLTTPVATLGSLGSVLATPRLVTAVSFTAFFVGGLYVVYTFMAPLLEARLGLGRDGVTGMLVVFGLGAFAGNAMGGFLTDRIGAARTLALLCAAQVVLMPAVTETRLSLVGTGALVALWSLCAWSFMVAQQARLAALEPPRTPILFALNAAAIYLGGSIGSFVGGRVLNGAGLDTLGWAGAAIVAVAAFSLYAVSRSGHLR